MRDDGIGTAILRALTGDENGLVPLSSDLGPAPAVAGSAPSAPAVDFIDGGTAGMELLPHILDATDLLFLDAVIVPDAHPGEVVVLEGDQLPRLRSTKLSPHQVGLLDLLSAARVLGHDPRSVAVIGIYPQEAELGVGLSDGAAAALPEAVAAARDYIARFC